MDQDTVELPYKMVTNDIVIKVTPSYDPSRSNPEDNIYAYSYTVTIENQSDSDVQLINRHWKVFSNKRQIADVKGEGVIGEQPVIAQGAVYEYTSWTVVDDQIGSMLGAYTFVDAENEFFDVAIPEFHLIYVDSTEIH